MHRPLQGRRILVTRPRAQAESLCVALEAEGAVPVRFPVIQVEPVPDDQSLRESMTRLAQFQWVIFTSVNGVVHACKHQEGPFPTDTRAAAIGPATAHALAQQGIPVSFVPHEYRAECLADGVDIKAGQRVLLPRAQGARRILVDMLREKGAIVKEIAAYRTVHDHPDSNAFSELKKGVDAVTLSSPSSARSLATMVRTQYLGPVICIGPVTAKAAQSLGFDVASVAQRYTAPGLMDAVTDYFRATIPDV